MEELTLRCLRPAAEARLCDGGRPGRRALGVPTGGPADAPAAAAANRLLSQPDATPVLELALHGGRWELAGTGAFVLTGADLGAVWNGEAVPRYATIFLEGETGTLEFGFARAGCRAYLGLGGRWALPEVMGSVEAGLPGVRDPADGAPITVVRKTETKLASSLEVPIYDEDVLLRVRTGPEWPELPEEVRRWLRSTRFGIGRSSNRQGLRLEAAGPVPPVPNAMLSSPVLPGTVQLSPAGPLLLGPDAQTVGGYPRVLLLAEGELSRVYQLRPGGGSLVFRLG